MSTYREIDESEYKAIDRKADNIVSVSMDISCPSTAIEIFVEFLENEGYSVECLYSEKYAVELYRIEKTEVAPWE